MHQRYRVEKRSSGQGSTALSGRYRFAIFPEPILFGTPWANLYLNFTFAISSFGVNPSPKSSMSINLRISTTASPF